MALAQISRNSFGNLTPPRKTRFRKFPWKFDPSDEKSRPLSSAGALRSQDSPHDDLLASPMHRRDPRESIKKHLLRPFSGQGRGSYQKSDCSDWILNFSRPLRPVRDHIALGPSALGEKKSQISRKFPGNLRVLAWNWFLEI